MKNIVLSAVAVLAMSSFAVAGGDIAPVEEPVVVPEPVVTDAGFYLGLGYGWNGIEITDGTYADPADENFGAIMIDAGYKFNQYVAVEGRYWFGLGSSNDLGWRGLDSSVEADSWGIYVKPMYPVTDAFDVYALLGYGGTDLSVEDILAPGVTTDFDASGFSWGIGASYAFTDNVSLFIDYTSIITDEGIDLAGFALAEDLSVDNINFGVNYQF